MKCICKKKCIIGEGPVWNEREQRLYFVNGLAGELCTLDIITGELGIREGIDAAAIAFSTDNRVIVSTQRGICFLNPDNSLEEICRINYANDMKVGPDGRIYAGTQSLRRAGVADVIDGRLYSIDKEGNVRTLLDNLILSNGMDWSMDEKRFYHTDSDTHTICEYDFDKVSGDISYTGRCVEVIGVDGFTIDLADKIYAACWGQGHIAVVDTASMRITEYIPVPAKIPSSCTFCGSDMKNLAIVTASCGENDINAGYIFMTRRQVGGRLPYLFGGKYK